MLLINTALFCSVVISEDISGGGGTFISLVIKSLIVSFTCFSY